MDAETRTPLEIEALKNVGLKERVFGRSRCAVRYVRMGICTNYAVDKYLMVRMCMSV